MSAERTGRLNILVITSEDNGPHLGCYGDPCARTPHLDRLAREGALFRHAYVTQAVCSPSRASILTGRYPHQNGQLGLATHRFRMCREFPTASSLLKPAGYRTGRIGKLHVLPESACPFDFVWNDPKRISFWRRDVVETARVAGQFMAAAADPFFLYVNYCDAHLPWLRQDFGLPVNPFTPGEVRVPPAVGLDTGRLREHTANYYCCMSRLDTGIGLLMDELERTGHAEDTLVIYLGDHGPQFSRGKGATYELAVEVPFLVRWPGVGPAGQARSELVSSVDILPTVLDAAGVAAPDGLAGRSLRPLLAGGVADWRGHLFCEWNTSHPYPLPSFLYPQRSVRDDRYKLIATLLTGHENPVEEYYTKHVLVDTGTTQWEIDRAPDEVRRAYTAWRTPAPVELYDLAADPHEFDNLADRSGYAGVRDRLLTVLRQWQADTADPLADPDKLARLVAEDLRVQAAAGAHQAPGFSWEYTEYLYGVREG